MEKTERNIERGREMEREQGKGRQTETENEIKTAGIGKAGDRGESPGLQSLQPGLPRVWTPHLLFFGFHSNGEGSTKFAHTFTSFLSA